jgi:CheY-like chemotaxis protein
MLQEMAAEERIRERAQKIGKAADRCARIVRTFLAMARQSAPKRAEIDLRTMIEAALEIAGYGLRGGDIKVTLDLAPDMPRVWGDADQLSQVMMNLIVNAQQALCDQPPPRLLTIRSGVSPSTGYVELQVEDNGPGIREDIRPRIFEPFFTTKEEGVGTGVGLAVCRGIVRAHDGTIDVDSTPGEGTRFTVTLPPCTEDSSSDVEPQEPGPTASKLRVLVVDDEPQLVQTLAEILGAEGHQVLTASSGRAAQRALRAHEIDLILCDIRMPDLDGPGFYRELQRSDPELAKRIVFITGDALSANVRQFLDETDLPYLEKPIMPADLRELVVQQFAEVS